MKGIIIIHYTLIIRVANWMKCRYTTNDNGMNNLRPTKEMVGPHNEGRLP